MSMYNKSLFMRQARVLSKQLSPGKIPDIYSLSYGFFAVSI